VSSDHNPVHLNADVDFIEVIRTMPPIYDQVGAALERAQQRAWVRYFLSGDPNDDPDRRNAGKEA